jgi:hypothetical protein
MVGVMVGNKCRAVYVHYDGYLAGNGAELQGYTTQAEVEALIADGDRSSLTGGFYAERGETGVEPREYETFEEFYKAVKDCWGEYYYVFKDGVWYCGDTYEGTKLSKKLVAYAEAVKLQEEENEEECY